MGNLGAMELLLIAGIGMLVFGAGRVSELGKGLGQGIRNFKLGLRESSQATDVHPTATRLLDNGAPEGGEGKTVS